MSACVVSIDSEIPVLATGLAGPHPAHAHQPLRDKPENWHGKGYHYTNDDSIVDVWHWKAVRTNDMFIADDNFFGPPIEPR